MEFLRVLIYNGSAKERIPNIQYASFVHFGRFYNIEQKRLRSLCRLYTMYKEVLYLSSDKVREQRGGT